MILPDRPLRGRGIVVTRPALQAAGLVRLIEDAGGRALIYPMIEIEPVANAVPDALVETLERFDLAVFVSRNAVEQGLARVARSRVWPSNVAVAAVGSGTRAELEARGFTNVLAPGDSGGSESLLALLTPPVMNVRGKRIAIFRGIGGRELLAHTLRQRGAVVEYAECYRRKVPHVDLRPLIEAWSNGHVHAVAISSGEALVNLAALLGAAGGNLLASTPLFVPHPRVADEARAQGIGEPLLAGPADEDVADAMVAYFCGAR